MRLMKMFQKFLPNIHITKISASSLYHKIYSIKKRTVQILTETTITWSCSRIPETVPKFLFLQDKSTHTMQKYWKKHLWMQLLSHMDICYWISSRVLQKFAG